MRHLLLCNDSVAIGGIADMTRTPEIGRSCRTGSWRVIRTLSSERDKISSPIRQIAVSVRLDAAEFDHVAPLRTTCAATGLSETICVPKKRSQKELVTPKLPGTFV